MNPLVKKVLAAVAVKEAIEKVQEMRRPKPSLWSRLSPFALVAALGGALFYLNKSGMLEGIKGKSGSGGSASTGSASNGSGSWNGGSTASSPSTTAPSPTV